MALLSSYATVEQYEARTGQKDSGTGALLEANLLAMSRQLEFDLGRPPGAFNSSGPGVTRYFNGDGDAVLDLLDEAGWHTLTAATQIVVLGSDGSALHTIDPATDTWCALTPRNAAGLGRPYEAIELYPRSGATLSRWPEGRANVGVTGTWGCAAVDERIVDLVVHATRDLRSSHLRQDGQQVPAFDGAEALYQPQTWRLWLAIKRAYNRRIGIA